MAAKPQGSRRHDGRRAAKRWRAAQAVLAHGVDSPVRSWGAVGGVPVFAARGRGVHVWDPDGRRYIDYVGGWGPLILGHDAAPVRQAIRQQVTRGTTFGMPHEAETRLAAMIREALPSMERVRLTCSGTEACMSAVRLARAATGRSKILKFAGCYHGHADSFLVKAGSGVATFGGSVASSAGVAPALAADTLVAEYNDLAAVRALCAAHGREVAAIIVEPWAANMGLVLPQPGFLQGLREIASRAGALLMFDEVITGFRAAYGGVQTLERIRPDLTVLGKIIGGGLPVGAFGGRKEIMELLAPGGPVYQAGTLAGHPLAMRAGAATLEVLRRTRPYRRLAAATAQLAEGLRRAGQRAGVPLYVAQAASLLTCFFTGQPVRCFADARRADARRFGRFFHSMREQGVLLPPSAYEAWFVSTAHTERVVAATLRAAASALAA